MKEIETFLHLDSKKWTQEEIEEERGELLRQRMEAMLDLRDLILNSHEYKKVSRINEILSVKMIQMSDEERKIEYENATKEITERDYILDNL